MHTGSKIIYCISLVSIVVFVILPFVAQFTPLEFVNNSFQDLFERARFFGLPAVILLTLFGTLKSTDTTGIRISKIVFTICISFISVFVLSIIVFTDMCRWTNNKILFENEHDKTEKIILRDFGCGATDSGSPTFKVCKIKNITPFLIWVTGIDTAKIDKQIWRPAALKE